MQASRQPAEPEAGIGLPRAGALPNQQNNALRSKAWADATGVSEASRGETRQRIHVHPLSRGATK